MEKASTNLSYLNMIFKELISGTSIMRCSGWMLASLLIVSLSLNEYEFIGIFWCTHFYFSFSLPMGAGTVQDG